ncbi:TetR/AcrR family transcriptional regulator [Rivibacter subsaxonicus]|uniref:TetR family transcriptional regulator n=1 Tax=Rivibacter subsaxonicus TaxID=457575 RepID=A0A4Q7VNH0_9BURK|nr:TetR/AcrR family transcriptional regulator [Rivibacter subsaxonicus]RZT97774.1 TetR family transcriptional regulator [Rivibacter subsaxonicus]
MTTGSSPCGSSGARRRRKHARAGELRDAALSLFAEKGFDATRTEEIAARAGIAKGTLYLYFPSKEKLLQAAIASPALEALAKLRPMAGRAGSSTDVLRRMLLDIWTHLRNETVGRALKLAIAEAPRFPEIMDSCRCGVVKPLHASIAEVVRQGMDRGELRRMDADVVAHSLLLPMLMSCMHWHLIDPDASADRCLSEAFIPQHVELVLQGLAPAHGASVHP